jgi:hypothetical protein
VPLDGVYLTPIVKMTPSHSSGTVENTFPILSTSFQIAICNIVAKKNSADNFYLMSKDIIRFWIISRLKNKKILDNALILNY